MRMAFKSSFPRSYLIYSFLSLILFESTISVLLAILSAHFLQKGTNDQSCKFNLEVGIMNETTSWTKKVFIATYFTYYYGCSEDSNAFIRCSCNFSHTRRTRTWTFIYFIINSTWLITSLFLLTSIIINRNTIIRCFYYPWLITTNFVILSDLIATIQYSLDLLYTKDLESYAKFLGNNDAEYTEHISDSNKYSIQMAPLVMSVLFSRGIIIWLLNVFLFIHIICRINSQPQKEIPELSPVNESTVDQNELPQVTDGACEQFSLSGGDSGYVPWVNLVYIPTLYKGNNTKSEKSNDLYEEQREHQYEKVAYLNDVPGFINIEIPQHLHSGPQCYYKTGYYNLSDFKAIKINYGSVSIKVNRRKLLPKPTPGVPKTNTNSEQSSNSNVTSYLEHLY